MDEILLRFLRGEVRGSEEEQVTAWLRRSPDHKERLRELREILSLAQAMDSRVDPGEPPRATEVIFQAGVQAGHSRHLSRRRRSARSLVPLAAAAVAVLLTFGILGYERWIGSSDVAGLAAEEFMTGSAESSTIRMNDGSVIRLGPGSRLQVMTGGSNRQVVLEGRAFFSVTHNATRPFQVFAPAGSVRVLGTRFEMEADISGIRVVVIEGSVALAANDTEVLVRSGEMTEIIRGKQGEVRKGPGMAEISAEWMGQFLVFQDTPLTKAVEEIEELYGVDVQILGPALGGKTLTMWFSSQSLEDVLSVVCSVISASCRIDGKMVRIGVGIKNTPGHPGGQ